MLQLNIPGRGKIEIENIVFDYNGTLAVDGKIEENIKNKIKQLKNSVNVHILTADTYGTVEKVCEDLGVSIKTFPQENAAICKRDIVKSLGGKKIITVGNGFNDIDMFLESVISIAVIGAEGCSGKLIAAADIVVKSIEDVFEMLLKLDRIKATLRS